MYIEFMELEKANDKVCRELQLRVLFKHGAGKFLVRGMKSLRGGSRGYEKGKGSR